VLGERRRASSWCRAFISLKKMICSGSVASGGSLAAMTEPAGTRAVGFSLVLASAAPVEWIKCGKSL